MAPLFIEGPLVPLGILGMPFFHRRSFELLGEMMVEPLLALWIM
jgi:hypothetical protein